MQLSLSSIWPDFSSLTQGLGSSTSISAWFWVIQIIVFAFFCFKLIAGTVTSARNIGFFEKLLKGIDRSGLMSGRRELKEKTEKRIPCKGVWHEFDETLVLSSDGNHLYSTFDAAHFFNTHTLASRVTESRLLAAVPGFLTAIGVIGTFLGLQLGLGALELNTSDTEQLKSAISALISSASIAFMTSVWGVFLSLLFNAFEKIVEGKIRKRIAALQQRVDELFPRVVAEQALLDIHKESRQSRESLMGLAEQIGDRMQVAVRDMAHTLSSGMESSLERIMSPAIKQMVDASTDFASKQANSSEDALKHLLGEFMDGMGQAGAQQQSMMQQASQDMSRSMGEWGQGMSQFMGQLSQTLVRFEDMSRQQSQALAEQLDGFASTQKNQLEYSLEKTVSATDSLTDRMQQRIKQLSEQDQDRDQAIKTQLAEWQSTVALLIDDLRSSMEKQLQAADVVLRQAGVLNDGIQRNQSGLNQVSERLVSVSEQMEQVSENLEKGHQEVARATDELSGSLGQATTAVSGISQQNAQVAEGLQQTLEGLSTLESSLEEVSEDIRIGAENADNASRELSSNHARYRQEMQEAIESLHEQLGGLLNEYGRQVQDQTSHRMQEWNRNTQEYISGMQGVVSVMQELVDDMDSRRAA